MSASLRPPSRSTPLRLALLLAALAFSSAPSWGQVPVSEGDRIRLHLPRGGDLTGTLVRATADSVVLATDDGETVVVPRSPGLRVGASRGDGSFGKALGAVTLSGAAVGAVLAATTWDPDPGDDGGLYAGSRSDALLLGALAGAVVSLPIGLLAGLGSRGEQWTTATLPRAGLADGAPRLELRPWVGRSWGIQGTLRLGRRPR